jgi:hypothetical protein
MDILVQLVAVRRDDDTAILDRLDKACHFSSPFNLALLIEALEQAAERVVRKSVDIRSLGYETLGYGHLDWPAMLSPSYAWKAFRC